jgi:hypothetical protein
MMSFIVAFLLVFGAVGTASLQTAVEKETPPTVVTPFDFSGRPVFP